MLSTVTHTHTHTQRHTHACRKIEQSVRLNYKISFHAQSVNYDNDKDVKTSGRLARMRINNYALNVRVCV